MSARLLGWIGRRAEAALAAGVFAGLAAPALASSLRPLLAAAVAGLLVLSAMRIGPAAGDLRASRPLALAAVATAMLVAAPLLVWACCRALGLDPVLSAAMTLGAALPPLFSAPAMALVLGLDAGLMLGVVVLTTVASPFALALIAGPVLALELSLSPFALMLRLAGLMLGCLAAGALLRRAFGSERIGAARDALDGVTVALLLLFAVAIMDGVAAAFVTDPVRVAGYVVAAFAVNLGLQGVAALGTARLGARRALTLGFACGNRSLGVLLAVLPASADPGLSLFFALGQLPIYLLPGAMAPLYRRLLAGAGRRRR